MQQTFWIRTNYHASLGTPNDFPTELYNILSFILWSQDAGFLNNRGHWGIKVSSSEQSIPDFAPEDCFTDCLFFQGNDREFVEQYSTTTIRILDAADVYRPLTISILGTSNGFSRWPRTAAKIAIKLA
jgi:hypothetical protein